MPLFLPILCRIRRNVGVWGRGFGLGSGLEFSMDLISNDYIISVRRTIVGQFKRFRLLDVVFFMVQIWLSFDWHESILDLVGANSSARSVITYFNFIIITDWRLIVMLHNFGVSFGTEKYGILRYILK